VQEKNSFAWRGTSTFISLFLYKKSESFEKKKKKKKKTYSGHSKRVNDFCFRSDGLVGYSCGGENIVEWDIKSGKEIVYVLKKFLIKMIFYLNINLINY